MIALGIEGSEPFRPFGFVWGSPNENSGTGAIGDYVWIDADDGMVSGCRRGRDWAV